MLAISTFVLSAPGRAATTEKCLQSLRESDIGSDYAVCTQAPGQEPLDHWSKTFLSMADAPTPLVLMLEDDCLTNKHVLHNIRSWPWIHDAEFGAGWLYSPAGYKHGTDAWYTNKYIREWYGSVACLYWRKDLSTIHDVALNWMREGPRAPNRMWDCAVSWAVRSLGKKIRQHGPPLFEHMYLEPSAFGHKNNRKTHSTHGTFDADFRRVT